MMKYYCRAKPPILMIHAGAGTTTELVLNRRQAIIAEILKQLWPGMLDNGQAVHLVSRAVEIMEASPDFNAGRGASLQSDGLLRLSAGLMDGSKQRFSGVALVTHLIHPSKLALALQQKQSTVLGPLGAQLLARELGLPPENPTVIARVEKWLDYLKDRETEKEAQGTVGAVVIDSQGNLAAATSTGGSNACYPDRLSDSATPAGNYASNFAAISATGVGEQIVDDGLAVRIETRVRDGMSIIAASDLALDEAKEFQRKYGWIGLDKEGNQVMYATTDHMPCGAMSEDGIDIFAI